HAAADGRRAGVLRHDGDPQSSVDWALPTLFIAEGVDDPRLEVRPLSILRVWHEAAANYAPPDYPAYCDRADVVPLYNLLLADSLTQRSALTRPTDLQVLAVGVDQSDDDGPRLGRTWLLRDGRPGGAQRPPAVLAGRGSGDGRLPPRSVEGAPQSRPGGRD